MYEEVAAKPARDVDEFPFNRTQGSTLSVHPDTRQYDIPVIAPHLPSDTGVKDPAKTAGVCIGHAWTGPDACRTSQVCIDR